jgi:Contractile injection system tube protein
MSSFPGSPKVRKGAIIGIDRFNPLASVIIFQYNPETLTRTITAQTTGSDNAAKKEAMRLKGPPHEDFKLDVVIDATDQLEQAKAPATTMGLYPTLASLEMLLYPKSAATIANEVLAPLGMIEIIATEAPLTLFSWGPRRTVAVRITALTITEEAFDPNLNPILAKVSLSLRVLNYDDLGLLSVGGALFMAHQIQKEVMATISGVGAIAGGS